MIDTLIHFYRKGSLPFQSLSALPEEEALRRMQKLYVEGSTIWERFKDPRAYLLARRQTEAWLREAFIARGGQPRQPYPIYMVLGRTRWLDRHGDPATLATTAEINVPIGLFSAQDISFTYPDSMITRLLAEEKNPEYYLPDFHGVLFTLPEITSIIETKGLPGVNWGNNLPPHFANYIEAQVWNQHILAEFLSEDLGRHGLQQG
jgi:hypothetical protein